MTAKKIQKQTAVKLKLESLVKDLDTIRSGLSITYERTEGNPTTSGTYHREERERGGALNLHGVPLMGEGYERVSWPGTANVVAYSLFKEGVGRVEVYLGEEDWQCMVRAQKLLTVREFVTYASRRKGNLQNVKDSIQKYRASMNP